MPKLVSQLAGMLLLALFSQTANALDNITLQLKWTHAFQFAGYYAAKEQGYYREAGLEVNIIEATPQTNPLQLVLDGQAQFGVGTSSLLLERAAGKPVVVLAVIFQQSPYEIYASPNIHHLPDLIGKRLMIEPQADELLAYLKKEGIPIEKINILPHSFDANGLMQNKTDAISGYISNEPYFFRESSYPYQTFSPRSAGIDFYGDNLFTSEREVREHPDRVRAFRAASMRGWKYAKEHRDETIALILSKYTPHYSQDYLRFESDQMIPLLQPDLIEIGYMNPNRWHHIANTYADLGLMPHNFPLDDFIYVADETNLLLVYRWLVGALIFATLFLLILLYINRLNRKLTLANQSIALTLSEQSRFMDMLTHELKTPLATVRMALGAMQIRGTMKDHADRALQDMNDIIERCRQMDQLEQSKLQPCLRVCRIDELLRQLCDNNLKADEASRPITLRAENLPEINSDEQLLRIILDNLISNALKYSLPQTRIEIQAEAAVSKGVEGVRVTVVNEPGTAGIPDPNKLFCKYYRSPKASSKSGSGLGLYLVCGIAELLGGHITYDLVDGKVRFTLWLPV
ncbi:MAG: ABC transporter substrate-binding protein [Gallionellaceae bacterium]|jgi:signal transduction histidine kinase